MRAREIVRRLVRTIRWLPLLWEANEWGWYGLVSIMERQLWLMREYMLSDNAMCEGAKDVALDISLAHSILFGIANDCHGESWSQEHEEKWGAPQFKDGAVSKPGFREFSIVYEKATTPEEQELASRELVEGMLAAEVHRDEDLRLAMTTIADHLFEWWD